MLLSSRQVQATSWVVPTWEQLAQEADFIGVVECVTAGGIVARYRVEESLKGMAVGTEFLMEEFSDSMGNHYPVRLCGERMLVMAAKIKAPMERNSSDLFWTIPADYFALFFGTWELEYLPALKASFGDSVTSVKEAEEVIQKFLEASENEKERQTILSILRSDHRRFLHFVEGTRSNENGRLWEDLEISEEDIAKTAARLQTLQKHTDAKALIRQMLEMAPHEKVLGLWGALERGGVQVALDECKKQNTDAWSEDSVIQLNNVCHAIFKRLNRENQSEEVVAQEKVNKVRPNEDELLKYRQRVSELGSDDSRLGGNPFVIVDPESSKAWNAAVENLVAYDPDFLVAMLIAWPRSDDAAACKHVLIRLCFAAQGDRAELFMRLQEARDPLIQVMAAIYLCFENQDEGLKRLRQHSQLPGVAGAWAALTLARRGEKGAMPRVLEVFAPLDEGAKNLIFDPDQLRFILQQRLLVLLSNSAKNSNVPRFFFENYTTFYPEFGEGGVRERQLKALKKWWAEHADAIELHDPWRGVLEQEKKD